METKVIKSDSGKINTTAIADAARLIDAGGLVAFPTETVYGIACRAKTETLTKLNRLKGRTPDKYYTLHIGSKTYLPKYVPSINLRTEKLVKTAWPGPLTIVFQLEQQDIEKQKGCLEKEIFENLYKNNSIGIRCPDNNIASALLDLTNYPVVAPSANLTGRQPAVEAGQVTAQFRGQIDMILDGGPCRYGRNSSVVQTGRNGLEILREGAYSREKIEKLSTFNILIVCTGNTCRSPMAEGLFRKFLAEKLNCPVDNLKKMGYKVSSAGTMKMAISPAANEAVAACAARGVDIKAHKSTVISEQLVKESDLIFTMSRMHLENVTAISNEAESKTMLLAENESISDPVGQSQQVYNSCAAQIEKAVIKRISELNI